jgi:hypothetical protein
MFISAKWGSQKDGRVFIANKRDGSHLTTVEEHVGDVQGVAIYQMRQQSSGQNPCIKASCSDECVASFFTFTDYQCICPEGVRLLNDHHTCEHKAKRCNDTECNSNGQCVINSNNDPSCL